MAVKGKKQYTIYLDEADAETVMEFLDRSKSAGGMSALVNEYIANVARTLRESDLAKGQKLGWSKIFKLFINGLRATKHIGS